MIISAGSQNPGSYKRTITVFEFTRLFMKVYATANAKADFCTAYRSV